MSRGAAISFYTVFSLAPMLLLVIGIAGLAFGRDAAQGAITDQLAGLIGEGGAEAVQAMIRSAGNIGSGIVATATGVVTVLVFSTGVFVELQNALNAIWKARTSAGSGLLMFIRTRLISFGLILAIGFILMISLALNAALSAIGNHLTGSAPVFEVMLHAVDVISSLVVTTVLLAAIYKLMPDVDVAWTDVWSGAIATAVLLAIGKFAIGYYIGRAHLASSYGSASSLITILLWVYYASLIVLFGAELTKCAAENGRHAELSGHTDELSRGAAVSRPRPRSSA